MGEPELVIDYFRAIWNDMLARMSGLAALIFTLLQVFATSFNGANAVINYRRFWWIVAAICFVLTNFRIWRGEHLKLVAEQPKFILTLEHIDWSYEAPSEETIIIVALSILNRGAPSIAQGWLGSFQTGPINESMESVSLLDTWLLASPHSLPIPIEPSETILAKTLQNRIEKGALVLGRAFFALRGDRRTQLSNPTFSLVISCCDFNGTRFESDTAMPSELLTSRLVIPGEREMKLGGSSPRRAG